MSSVESDVYDIIAEKSAVDRSKLQRDAKLADLEIESLDVRHAAHAYEVAASRIADREHQDAQEQPKPDFHGILLS